MDEISCCVLECEETAEFEIKEDRTDLGPAEGFTFACREHVGELLGSCKLTGPDTTAWRVLTIETALAIWDA